MSLLAAAAVVTALVGLPAGTGAPPPGSVPVGAPVQVLDRQLGIVSVELPRAALARLRGAPGVRYAVVPQAAGGLAAAITPCSAVVVPRPPGAHPSTWRSTVSLASHRTAAGFTVGVADTGADLGRLGGTRDRLVSKNFTQGTGVDDEVGHGTEVASLIGANRGDLSSPVRGVAPDVGLAIARIGTTDNCDAASLSRNLILAFRWFRTIGDVQIVNLSLNLAPNAALLQSLRSLQQTGTLVVAATGNHANPGKATFPAAQPHVLGVGALGSSSKKVWPSSGRGADVDLVAPGAGSGVILSSALPDVATAQSGSTPDGTSFATPIVSGAAALVWARHPSWDASRVAAALTESAKHLSGARPNPSSGYGRLDVKAALKASPPADLDEPNEWPAAARLASPLAHGTTLRATVGGDDDPLDAYPLSTKGHSTVRLRSAHPMQAFLLRDASVDAIDRTLSTVRNAASARAAGRSIHLKVPRAGSWFVVVVESGAKAPVGYTLRVG